MKERKSEESEVAANFSPLVSATHAQTIAPLCPVPKPTETNFQHSSNNSFTLRYACSQPSFVLRWRLRNGGLHAGCGDEWEAAVPVTLSVRMAVACDSDRRDAFDQRYVATYVDCNGMVGCEV